MASVTTSSSLGTFLQSVLAAVKTDALKTVLPIVNNFLSAVIQNPSQANIVAQVALLQVQVLAALPNFEAAVAKDLAALVQQEIAALTAAPAATTTAAS